MGRINCTGSGQQPIEPEVETVEGDDGILMALSVRTPTREGSGYTRFFLGLAEDHPERRIGLCPVCHEIKKLGKAGQLLKHTRYISWKEQQALKENNG